MKESTDPEGTVSEGKIGRVMARAGGLGDCNDPIYTANIGNRLRFRPN